MRTGARQKCLHDIPTCRPIMLSGFFVQSRRSTRRMAPKQRSLAFCGWWASASGRNDPEVATPATPATPQLRNCPYRQKNYSHDRPHHHHPHHPPDFISLQSTSKQSPLERHVGRLLLLLLLLLTIHSASFFFLCLPFLFFLLTP